MIINSGATNIKGVPAFELGNTYDKYDIVYYSGYDESNVSYPCTQAQSGHYYYSGNSSQVATAANIPAGATSNWTTGFFFDVSYGATVDYKGLNYSTEYGDGYYNLLNKSENAVRATFNVSLEKRTDKETKAALHLLEDSFNKGNRPTGGYTGINWTPFPPYNMSGEFFVESFDHVYESPDVNKVTTTFYNETASLTDWKQLYIPFTNTKGDYINDITYYQHDIAYLRTLPETPLVLDGQSGWYYFTGEKHVDYSADTGILGSVFNSPSGQYTLWSKDKFYFDINQGLNIPQNPRFTKQDLRNEFTQRFSDGINKNLLLFTVTFQGRNDKETKAMLHFLEHHRGTQLFQFTPPAPYNFTNKVFVASTWSHNIHFKDNNDITVEMREFPIDYLNVSQSFRTLVTVVNRPVPEWGGNVGGNLGGKLAGSVSTEQRREGLDFVGATGIRTYVATGFSLRTGFYLTNSGNTPIETFLDITSPYSTFEFPSGDADSPLVTSPGNSTFVPFYFKGLQDNLTTPGFNIGPDGSGVFTGVLNLRSRSRQNGIFDPSGTISFGITGYVTGWDSNPYKGMDGQNPMHPHKFLIQTGYASASGIPINVLHWTHPVTGYYLNRYNIEYTQDKDWGNWSGIRAHDASSPQNIPGITATGFEINKKLVESFGYDYAIGGGVSTNLYTGIQVPPSLIGEAQIPVASQNVPDPLNTGVQQSSFFMHSGEEGSPLNHGEDYYYRMRSEYVQPNSQLSPEADVISGSMYVYGSGVGTFNVPTSFAVATGLGRLSPDYIFDKSRTKISTREKGSFNVFLKHQAHNVNLSGAFLQGLVDAGMVKQQVIEGKVTDMEVGGGLTALDVANTGAYADNFTGVKFILRPGYVIGSNKTGGPAVETGDQLLTGISPTHASKPIRETPSVLVMQNRSAIVGQGGDGGDGGYTIVKSELPTAGTTPEGGSQSLFTLHLTIGNKQDSTAGGDGGDALYVSHPDIAQFSIRKDYNSLIYAGGGGGGGGDRFLAEKLFGYLSPGQHQGGSKPDPGATNSTLGEGRGNDYTKVWTINNTIQISNTDGSILVKPTATMKTKWGVETGAGGQVIFRASNFQGQHKAGAGGGGAGFMNSQGGTQYNKDGSTVPPSTMGGYNFFGKGSFQGVVAGGSMRAGGKNNSWGGDGGDYGLDGQDGEIFNKETTGYPFHLPPSGGDGKTGGSAGQAISVVAASGGGLNTNYTQANYRAKLLVLTPSASTPSDIPGLVAHFDASHNVFQSDKVAVINNAAGYAAGTNTMTVDKLPVEITSGTTLTFANGATFALTSTAAVNATSIVSTTGLTGAAVVDNEVGGVVVTASDDSVVRWYSKNDSNVYLTQDTANNQPTFQNANKTDTSIPGSTDATVKHTYFNNQKYIYFSAPSTSHVDYMNLYNATANSSYAGDVRINNNGLEYLPSATAQAITIDAISFSIANGTTFRFPRGASFQLTAAADYTGTPLTSLTGKLYKAKLKDDDRGFYRLSSLASGFEIFYVVYPNRWLDGTSNFTCSIETDYSENTPGIDNYHQTGWCAFSPKTTSLSNAFYGREDGQVHDNTGLGPKHSLSFADWTRTIVRDPVIAPGRSWIYHLKGEAYKGNMRVTAKNNGITVGYGVFKASKFNFNASGDVLIGATSATKGFRGGIAAVLLYNKGLTGQQRRVVYGNLMNKYLRTKSATTTSETSIDFTNLKSDSNGLAGRVLFNS